MKDLIYFDNNATTKLSNQVLLAMNEVYKQPINTSSTHKLGRVGSRYLNIAKEQIVNLLNCQNYQITFTSGATEANNMALSAFANYQIIAARSEHLSILEVANRKKGVFIDVNKDGLIELDNFEDILKSLKTKDFLVSIMLANNETGVIQNIKEIAKITHKYGGLIHSDITQGLGKIKIDLEDLNIDLASISAHKIYGPHGVGALLVRNAIDVEPLIYGGMQEDGKRAGTPNIAGIVGFGKACEEASDILENYQNIVNLRNDLEKNLENIAANDLTIFAKSAKRLPNTSYFACRDLDNQASMINLDLNNIMVSIGSACSSGVTKNSHVLKSMGVGDKLSRTAIRVSLGKDNNKSEIEKFCQIWQDLYNKNKNYDDQK